MACGEDLPINAIYCPKCGKKLETSQSESISQAAKPSEEAAQVDLKERITPKASLDGNEMSETEEITDSNPTKKYTLIFSLILIAICSVIIWGLTSNSSDLASSDISAKSNSKSTPDPSDLLGRLNIPGGGTWEDDPVLPLKKPYGYLQSFFVTKSLDSHDCKVFVFDSESSAKKAFDKNTVDNLGTKLYASDILTSKGIILTSDRTSSSCFTHALTIFYLEVDPSLLKDSSSPEGNTSATTESSGSFSESKLREALLLNCTNLPSRFGTMKFQEGTVIYDAYGMPWGTYALGGTNFAVRDDSSEWHISGMDQNSNDDLISWECDTTFDIGK